MYYSQNGEDFLLWSLFKRKTTPGVFVEVGALDGIRFSNTYSFECEGWMGVCIEPHPDYFPLLRANRLGSYCIQAAASNHTGKVEFFAEPRGEFSTLIEANTQNEMLSKKMEGYKKIIVSTVTLDSILENASINPPIDFVSIDVEGAELNVLNGFNLALYRPSVLVIEANDEVYNNKLDAYMQQHRYFKAGRLGRSNNFYCRSWLDAVRLAFKPINCTVHIHPLPMEKRDENLRRVRQSSLAVQSWKKFAKRVVRRINLR